VSSEEGIGVSERATHRLLPYFGYGTLLGESHMKRSYPSSETLGTAVYEDHELAFHRYGSQDEGGCTIVERPGASLYGVLYHLHETDMARLLEVGGAASFYEAREITVRRPSGELTRAITLRVEGNAGPWAPPEPYGRLVTDGAAEANLPPDYRAHLVQTIENARVQGAEPPPTR
jgi:hypothetical protein